ncbi:hypothetical protein EDD21DRAFT_304169 [Dissophora ornata]|nr:hypothetical protein EDD21DRAFT_304169 [Dissophora ornata]
MSFEFDWDKLDDEVALQIEGMIHAHFQRIPKPSFMGNIAVSKFRFGSTPPSITVLDVTDPLEEWYIHMDQEEARLAQEAAEAGGGERRDNRNLDKRRRRRRGDGRGGYGRGEPRTPASYSPPPLPSKRHENDIQLLLSVQYQGQMGFTVETELLLNYPTFAFLALPVKLVITGFSFKGEEAVLMAYLRDHVNVCFLEPEDPNESILPNVRVESQVGEEQKQAVLKNVGKIERFVVEQLRKFITEDFVYPSYHSIELVRAPPPPPPPPLGGVSPMPSSSAAASTTTARHRARATSEVHGSNTHASPSRGSAASSTATSASRSVQSGMGREASSSLRARSNTSTTQNLSYRRQ